MLAVSLRFIDSRDREYYVMLLIRPEWDDENPKPGGSGKYLCSGTEIT